MPKKSILTLLLIALALTASAAVMPPTNFLVSVGYLNTKLAGIYTNAVNAKYYGAKGNAVSTEDDWFVLQQCIESNRFKQIFLPRGTYYISRPLVLYDRQSLIGEIPLCYPESTNKYESGLWASNFWPTTICPMSSFPAVITGADLGRTNYANGMKSALVMTIGCFERNNDNDNMWWHYASIENLSLDCRTQNINGLWIDSPGEQSLVRRVTAINGNTGLLITRSPIPARIEQFRAEYMMEGAIRIAGHANGAAGYKDAYGHVGLYDCSADFIDTAPIIVEGGVCVLVDRFKFEYGWTNKTVPLCLIRGNWSDESYCQRCAIDWRGSTALSYAPGYTSVGDSMFLITTNGGTQSGIYPARAKIFCSSSVGYCFTNIIKDEPLNYTLPWNPSDRVSQGGGLLVYQPYDYITVISPDFKVVTTNYTSRFFAKNVDFSVPGNNYEARMPAYVLITNAWGGTHAALGFDNGWRNNGTNDEPWAGIYMGSSAYDPFYLNVDYGTNAAGTNWPIANQKIFQLTRDNIMRFWANIGGYPINEAAVAVEHFKYGDSNVTFNVPVVIDNVSRSSWPQTYPYVWPDISVATWKYNKKAAYAITVDDGTTCVNDTDVGYLSNQLMIATKEYNFPVTFAVSFNSAFLTAYATNCLRYWHTNGVEIGGHGYSHWGATNCGGDAACIQYSWDQVTNCIKAITNILGTRNVQAWVWPYGSINEQTLQAVTSNCVSARGVGGQVNWIDTYNPYLVESGYYTVYDTNADGTYSDMAYMSNVYQHFDRVDAARGLGTWMWHGAWRATNQASYLQTAATWRMFLEELKTNRTDWWIDTFGNVGSYSRLRNDCVLIVTNSYIDKGYSGPGFPDEVVVEFYLTTTLNTNLYRGPLTLMFLRPITWEPNTARIYPTTRGYVWEDKDYVYADVYPTPGNVSTKLIALLSDTTAKRFISTVPVVTNTTWLKTHNNERISPENLEPTKRFMLQDHFIGGLGGSAVASQDLPWSTAVGTNGVNRGRNVVNRYGIRESCTSSNWIRAYYGAAHVYDGMFFITNGNWSCSYVFLIPQTNDIFVRYGIGIPDGPAYSADGAYQNGMWLQYNDTNLTTFRWVVNSGSVTVLSTNSSVSPIENGWNVMHMYSPSAGVYCGVINNVTNVWTTNNVPTVPVSPAFMHRATSVGNWRTNWLDYFELKLSNPSR